MDEAVRGLGREIGPRVAVVALGGYGRQSLCPGSDVDLMVLHRERRAERVREAAERLFYPFWDAGLPLGHAVRTIRECLGISRERFDAATALLDARLVWGDESLFEELRGELRGVLGANPRDFLERLTAGRTERLRAHGSCSEMLEPDLKEGIGGLRDVHSLGWIGRALFGADGPAGLVDRGLLRAPELDAVDEAEEFLVRARSALHLESAKRRDRLFLEDQAAMAEAFGFEREEGLGATDVLMRHLFEHARHVEHVTELVLGRSRPAPGAPGDIPAPRAPEDVMEAFAEAARRDAALPPGSLDVIEATDLGHPPYAWTPRTLRAFLSLLGEGERGARALEAMDRTGQVVRFLPEWTAVRCRPQRDPYHRFPVDVHLMRAAAEAAGILSGELPDDPVAAQAAAAVTDRDSVLLGAFLHDIGKVGEGPHVPVGVRVARGALERMGVPQPTRDRALFLVEHHLLLSDLATRRDLDDENLVLDVAATVGDPERLAMLYVLTAADAVATGPHAWTPWRQALVRELVGKVEHVLGREEMGASRAEELAARTGRVRRLLEPGDAAAVAGYLDRMPRPYLLAVPPETVARHFALIAPPLARSEVRTAASPGPRPGTHDLVVVAPDRPGLLAKVAGALALNGLNILSARAFTTEDGVAVDLFVVEGAFDREIEEERWRRVRSDLRKALEGRISLEYRVREKRRHYPGPRPGVPTKVVVDNAASDFFTVVEVSAADRIGLLYDIATALEEVALDVHVAKVATYGPRVIDAFYVRDLFGSKAAEPEHRREIERAIVSRLTSAAAGSWGPGR